MAAAVTCDSPTDALRVRPGALAIEVDLGRNAGLVFSGLSVTTARITVIRPPNDTVAGPVTFSFHPDSAQIHPQIEVPVQGNSEQFDVVVELLAGTTPVFTGVQQVTVTAGQSTAPTTPVPVTYQGPGTNLASIRIMPRDSGVTLGQSFTFRASALDSSGGSVAQFYLSWALRGTGHTLNADGVFTAGNQRGAVWVVATTPTGIKDSTRVYVVPTATAVAALSGSGQSGSTGTRLGSPMVARVTAADGGPVAGVRVAFAVTAGGGSVDSASVVTDSAGRAGTTVILGPNPGTNSYTATVTGLAPATFTATGTSPLQPRIFLSIPDSLVGVGFTQPLRVYLIPSAPAGGVTVSLVNDSTSYLSIAAPGTVTVPAGDSIRTINVTGVAAGVVKVRATAPGYPNDSLITAVIPPFVQVTPTTATVGVAATTNLTVRPFPRISSTALAVTMSSNATAVATVAPATLNLAVGQLTGTATVTGVASGTTAINANAAGYTPGIAAITVGTGGVPSTLQVQAGNNQTAFVNDTLPLRLQARVLDAGGAPVQGITVLFTVTGGGGSISVPTALTNAAGIAVAAAPWRMGGTPGANAMSASLPAFPAVTAVTFSATSTPPPPVIALSIFGSTVVGQARTGQLDVKLLQPAPAGGLTVNLVTRRAGLLRIGTYTSENGSATFAQGDTLKSVTVFGDSLATGIDTVIATGTGYTPDTLAVPISLNLISLPPTLNVALSQNVSLPINLSVAAPAGGLKVAIASSAPGVIGVVTDTVTVPQGSQVANATVSGVSIGTATLTATNPNYAPFSTAATVTASLNITQTSISPNVSFGLPVVVQLESGGLPVSAPAGGIPVTLTSRNPTCFTAANTTIPSGNINVAALVTYGGSAPTPCTGYLVASGPAGFTTDSVFVNMQGQPATFVSATYLGAGLQRNVSGSLGASNHGGTTVRVTSTNPSLFLIALTDSTAGAAFQDINVPINQSSFSYWIQALEGTVNDSANMIATAPLFVPDTAKLNVYQPVFDIIFLNGTGNTRTANDPFQVRTGSPFSPTGGISIEDAIRSGGTPMTATIINDSVAVGQLITTAVTGDTVTVTVPVRQARSPSTVALGGVEFDYTAAGVTNVRASAPGYRSVGPAAGQAVTVSAPVVFMNPTYIGARLQRQHSGSLSAVGIAGDTITLKTTRPGVLRLSPGNNDSTGFADSIQVPIGVGSTSFSFYIQGVDSIVSDSVDVIATLPGFTADTARYTVHAPVFDVIFLNGSGNTRSANDPFQVRIGSAFTATGTISVEDVLRFGHPALTFSVINDSVAVGELITTARTGDSVTVGITARQSRSPSTVATGGVEFDYTAGGVTNVRASSAGGLFRPVSTALGQAITVSAPSIFMNPTYIGARLQRQHSGSLSAVSVAGDTITLKTTRPGVLRISPGLNDSTGFADSIQIGLNPGSGSFSFYIQGVDSIVSDSVDVIATMPAYTADTARYTVHQPVFDIIFLNSTANALAVNDPFQVRIGSSFSATGTISVEDVLRFGHAPITATLNTSQATVAQLVTQAGPGSTGQVSIQPRQARSPSTVATGGVELDYLTTGSTVVTATMPNFRITSGDTVPVTVTAPVASLSAITVGSGLQESTSGFLSSGNHGGINVVVKSSNPAVALVSPNVSTPGTDSIIIAVPPGNTSFGYYVQGVEGVTGSPQQVQFRAVAQGFTDGVATMTVVQPAVDVIFLAGTGLSTAADDPFQVRVGYANSPSNTSMNVEQAVRAGAPGPLTVTITSTAPAIGALTTSTQTAQPSVTVQIPVGQARSPTTVATGGVAFDFLSAGQTFVVPTLTGYITVMQTVAGTPGFRVTVN